MKESLVSSSNFLLPPVHKAGTDKTIHQVPSNNEGEYFEYLYSKCPGPSLFVP